MKNSYGDKLRKELATGVTIPFIGCYDVFSAAVAAQYFNAIFVSGFGFSASHYGMPDIGFVAWPDIVDFVTRLRAILPDHHILVDIDDGYVDIETAKHVTRLLNDVGASGIVIEDQQRPRRCGHYTGKKLLTIDDFMTKLNEILAVSGGLFVVARTDASDLEDIKNRTARFSESKADAILVDGVSDIARIIKALHAPKLYYVYNMIFGGRSKSFTLQQLNQLNIAIALYSTPCLFAAHYAVDQAMQQLKQSHGNLEAIKDTVDLKICTEFLFKNMNRSFEGRD